MLYRARILREERKRRFEELRQAHRPKRARRFSWLQIVGVVLMGYAVSLALDPEYPISRELALAASAPPTVVLLPSGIEPVGDIGDGEPVFSWDWNGPDVGSWSLVLLDRDFTERGRMIEVQGHSVEPDASMRRTMAGGRTWYWCVESELGGQRFRSVPVEFCLTDSPAAPGK